MPLKPHVSSSFGSIATGVRVVLDTFNFDQGSSKCCGSGIEVLFPLLLSVTYSKSSIGGSADNP